MIRVLLILFSIIALNANEFSISKVKKLYLNKSFVVNAKVIQSSTQKEDISSYFSGKIVDYFIKEGEYVKKGQKLALVESVEFFEQNKRLAKLESRYKVAKALYEDGKKLYNIGTLSKVELQKLSLELKLLTEDIDNLKKRVDMVERVSKNRFFIKSNKEAYLSKVYLPKNKLFDKNSILFSLSSKKLSLEAYLPLKYQSTLNQIIKATTTIQNHTYQLKLSKILPQLDSKTKQIVAIFEFIGDNHTLFLGSFVDLKLFLKTKKSYNTVKKSAITFLGGEWVVFIPKDIQEHHQDDIDIDEEKDDEHHHDELEFDFKVIKILDRNSEVVAIEGLKENESYIDNDTHHIKSLLLKSSIGGHGH